MPSLDRMTMDISGQLCVAFMRLTSVLILTKVIGAPSEYWSHDFFRKIMHEACRFQASKFGICVTTKCTKIKVIPSDLCMFHHFHDGLKSPYLWMFGDFV